MSSLREAMPATAALVDELRQALGREKVDAAIASGMRARREHDRLAKEYGPAHAARWLRRQTFPAGAFFAREAGLEVGVELT